MWVEAENGNLYNLHYASSVRISRNDGKFAVVAELIFEDENELFGGGRSKREITLKTLDTQDLADQCLRYILGSAPRGLALKDWPQSVTWSAS